MAGVFDFLHIKRRTAGSSNELSFDVLDAARHQLDSQKKQGRRKQGEGPIAQSRNRGGHASTLSAEAEVKRRKRVRRNQSIRLKVLGALAAIVILCAGIAVSYGMYQQKMDFNDHLSNMVSLVMEVDDSLVQMDDLMQNPFDAFGAEDRAAMAEKLPSMEAELGKVDALAEDVASQPAYESEAVALSEVRAVVQARRDLIDAAERAFALSSEMNEQANAANRVWSRVIDADQEVRQAASMANKATTEEETLAARAATQQAIERLRGAGDDLVAIEQQVDGLGFKGQRDYLAKRIEALESAIATSDALLEGDREAAAAANESYNELEREAASMAEGLPASVGDLVEEAFRVRMDQALAGYDEVRSQVIVADSNLRERLP